MFNQKSVLARLLANENINVQQGNYDTAYFDVISRTLGLPLWKDMGKDVYDMLVGHEVAHALYTPANFFEYEGAKGVPHSWLNIVEDVRIEKLILRRYPGLVGNFKRAYNALMMGEDDLFGLKDKDISTLGFMDRLNIHAKARDLIEVSFAADELPFVAQVKACETYDDVIKACQDIQAWLKQKADDQQKNDQGDDDNSEGDDDRKGADVSTRTDDTSESGEDGDDGQASDDDQDGDDGEKQAQGQKGDEGQDSDEGEVESKSPTKPESGLMDQEALTDVNFSQNASKLTAKGSVYAKGLTRQQAYASIVPYAVIAESRRQRVSKGFWGDPPKFPEAAYSEFLTDTKRVVNLMVKEFEMRKAAYRSLRARESNKGSIDVNKLHKYQYDDMLFKQVSHLADAKNHGMMMLIDYSGSMYNILPGVIRQTLTLLMFCKRVGIPFEVYSFTSLGGSDNWKNVSDAKRIARPDVTRVSSEELALLKLFDSTMSKRDYDEAFRMMFWQTVDRQTTASYFEQLGNTPLNTALMAMQYLISDFRQKYKVQKMNFVSLTDGDSNGLSVVQGSDIKAGQYVQGNKYAIEVNGKIIEVSPSRGDDVTATFVKAIGNMGVTTMNYFVGHSYQLGGEISRALDYASKNDATFKAKKKEMRDTGVALFDNNAGYDRRFIVPSTSVDASIDDLDVDADMTTAKIAKAFSKASGSKKKSKVITQKFAELIA